MQARSNLFPRETNALGRMARTVEMQGVQGNGFGGEELVTDQHRADGSVQTWGT